MFANQDCMMLGDEKENLFWESYKIMNQKFA
jgi:hypothetical protein